MKSVCYELLYESEESELATQTPKDSNIQKNIRKNALPISASNNDYFNKLFAEETEQQESYINNSQEGAFKFQKQQEIKEEVQKFASLLSNPLFLKETLSSIDFWINNENKFPNLSKIYLMLSTITSSSAFIERFFSICGVIFDKRNQNSKDDLFITRSMLASNIKILDELVSTQK